jgi:sugar lactone lactonase YvrE
LFSPRGTQVAGGTGSITFSDPTGQIASLVVDATNMYFTDPALGRLMTLPLSGLTMAMPVVTGQASPRGLAMDSSHLYWINTGNGVGMGAVMSAPLGSMQATMLASNLDGPQGIVTDGTYVYWTDSTDGTVLRLPAGGGTASPMASAQSAPGPLALDAQSLYWLNQGSGQVMKLAK